MRRLDLADHLPQLIPVLAGAVRRQLIERAALVPDSGLAACRALNTSAGEREGSAAAGAPEELQAHD
jgi:hypothetical protein